MDVSRFARIFDTQRASKRAAVRAQVRKDRKDRARQNERVRRMLLQSAGVSLDAFVQQKCKADKKFRKRYRKQMLDAVKRGEITQERADQIIKEAGA